MHGSFRDQQQQGDAENRRCQNLDDTGRISRPQKEWHPEPSHPRRSHGVDRDDEIEPGEDRAEPENERAIVAAITEVFVVVLYGV